MKSYIGRSLGLHTVEEAHRILNDEFPAVKITKGGPRKPTYGKMKDVIPQWYKTEQ